MCITVWSLCVAVVRVLCGVLNPYNVCNKNIFVFSSKAKQTFYCRKWMRWHSGVMKIDGGQRKIYQHNMYRWGIVHIYVLKHFHFFFRLLSRHSIVYCDAFRPIYSFSKVLYNTNPCVQQHINVKIIAICFNMCVVRLLSITTHKHHILFQR